MREVSMNEGREARQLSSTGVSRTSHTCQTADEVFGGCLETGGTWPRIVCNGFLLVILRIYPVDTIMTPLVGIL